ncbi:MAG TPA: MOP flippase family protein [Candidatus Sulfopaludibacter sp.]|nr:MOP flippase family protein [Candidatus Sulfopaludibacter sp.]
MSLKKQVVSGSVWTTISFGAQSIVQILRLSILTRFLEKSDFGLVAIVSLVIGFTHIFADLGVSVSLYSRKTISKKEYSSLYWVGLLLGLFLYCILCLLAPFISRFYQMTELSILIPVMAVDLLIVTAGRQFRIFREKSLKFKSLAIIDIVASSSSIVIAIWVAVKGGGVWSIVFSALFASFISSILLIVMGLQSHPLVLIINLKEGRVFYKIGLYQTGSQILDYFASQLDILIIGKVMTATDLGVYNLIKQLVLKIYGMINPIISKVAIPVLATLNDNFVLLKERYLQMIKISSFVNLAVYGVTAFLSKEILMFLYGESYVASSLILEILCIWGGIISIMSIASSIIVVTGKTDVGFQWTLIRVIANPLFIIAGYQFGLIGIVISQSLYSLVFYTIYWKLVINKILKLLKFTEFLLCLLRFFLSALILFLIFTMFKNYLSMSYVWLNLVVFGSFYLIGYLILNRSVWKQFKFYIITSITGK